jgi:murein L,D-transpeptidase YcbB/YkuD
MAALCAICALFAAAVPGLAQEAGTPPAKPADVLQVSAPGHESAPATPKEHEPARPEAPKDEPVKAAAVPEPATPPTEKLAETPQKEPEKPAKSTDPAPAPLPAPATATVEPVTPAPAVPASPAPATPATAEPSAPVAPPAPAPAAPPAAAAAPAFTLDIAEAARRLGPRAGADRRELDAIVAFYAARQSRPHWHSEKGRTPAAEKLVAEVSRAADYGLDPAAFELAALKTGPAPDAAPDQLAADEVRLSQAFLRYARQARGGRIDPPSLTKFLDRQPRLFDAASLLEQVATATDPGAYLRQLHPRHPQFERLRQRYLAMRKANMQVANLPTIPDGPRIQPGASHPHVALVRARLGLAAAKVQGGGAADDDRFDEALVKAVRDFQVARNLRPADGSIANGTRHALNSLALGNPKKILANMEQWRWMPEDLGSLYVWVNIPEFTLRVVQEDRVVHTERVIVGKTDTQTPIFSDEMEQVIFHPFWGVPDGIKANEIQPSLARGSYSVLAKHNLRIAMNGRDIDPSSINWSSADMRRFHVYQPPGGDNVLGVVKFRFPNKHDVYMHDTPTKGLFQTAVRTYSHGCMRVQNPVRLAEILLAEDKRMGADRVRALATPGAPQNNQINLTRRIPVHITYFTATVEDDSKPRYFPDVYGHENRINLALEGKAHLIAKVPEPKGPTRADAVGRLSETQAGAFFRDWMRNVFGNN